MTTESQRQQIKEHLLKGKGISPLTALYKYGCMRLGARIWELRHIENLPIITKRDEVKKYARYEIDFNQLQKAS